MTLRALGGNATSRALVTLDGVPMSDPFFGYVPFAAIVPETLGSVDVTRGGGSGPFGAGALAGTIALQTAGIEQLSPVSASLLVNERGETEVAGTLATRLGGGAVFASGRWDRGQGFFTTPADQRVPATARAGFDARSGQVRAAVALGNATTLQARVLAFEDNRTLRFEGADSSASGQDASVRIVSRGRWQFDALAYLQARNFSNVVISSTRFVRVLNQRNTPSTGLGGKLEVRPPVGSSTVVRLGTDFRRSEGELQEEAYSAFTGNLTARRRAGGATENLGLFAEADHDFGALVLTGGIRADRTSIAPGFFRESDAAGAVQVEDRFAGRADWSVTGRGGVLFEASDTFSLRAAAYSGLRLPTLNELYRPFRGVPGGDAGQCAAGEREAAGLRGRAGLAPCRRCRAKPDRVRQPAGKRHRQCHARAEPAPAAEPAGDRCARDRGGREHRPRLVEPERFARLHRCAGRRRRRIAGAGWQSPAAKPALGRGGDAGLCSRERRGRVGDTAACRRAFESDLETDRFPATTIGAFVQVPLLSGFALVLRGENLTDERIVTRNAGGDIDLGVPRTVWAGLEIRVLTGTMGRSLAFMLGSCVAVMALISWVSWHKTRGSTTRDGYFLADRGLGAAFIAGSLVVLNGPE